LTPDLVWSLSLTKKDQAGTELGRYATRFDAMLAGQAHFEKEISADDEELGWQMSHNGATALSAIGNYRVRRI
jgi:hypothetical protein